MPVQAASQPTLKRSLGLGLITLYGLGNILGAGIYVLVGKVAGAAGVHAPLAFVIAALVATITAFTYGELAARHPVSAGEAVYMDAAFALRILSVAVGVLIAAAGMVSAAALARGFVGYLQDLAELLTPAGVVFLAIPDKRRTLDRDRPSTTLDVLLERRFMRASDAPLSQVMEFARSKYVVAPSR